MVEMQVVSGLELESEFGPGYGRTVCPLPVLPAGAVMPTYRFWCMICNAEREVVQPYNAAPPWCAACESEGAQPYPVRMVRQPSAPAFSVKGFNAKNGYSK